jgi:riboflavin synthase
MFTGLISGVGTIRAVAPIGNGQDARFTVEVPQNDDWDMSRVKLGASIACSGCCLTAIELGADFFTVEASAETLSLTTLGAWAPGTKINLEKSLKLGDELGGHLVSGHVDGLANVISATPEHGSTRWRFALPASLARFVAPKGSIAINGVSLTVNDVQEKDGVSTFGVNIIPHTALNTTFHDLKTGDRVNIEIDMLARYVARLTEFSA